MVVQPVALDWQNNLLLQLILMLVENLAKALTNLRCNTQKTYSYIRPLNFLYPHFLYPVILVDMHNY